MAAFLDEMGFEKRETNHEAKEDEQQGKDRNRPTGADALAAQEHPAHCASFPWIGGDGEVFGRESCVRDSFGGRRFRQWGLNLRLHGASFKWIQICVCRILLKILYESTILGVP